MTTCTATPSSSAPSRGPTTLPSARALPPVAYAAWGRGGVSPANTRVTSACASAIAVLVGGSSASARRVSRNEPMSSERTQAGSSPGEPTAICVEPPPTSHTAMLAGGWASVPSTPR